MNGPTLHVDIEFEFGDIVADHAGMWVRLRAGSYTYETGRWFYWNLQHFADGLAQMHSDLKGIAHFTIGTVRPCSAWRCSIPFAA